MSHHAGSSAPPEADGGWVHVTPKSRRRGPKPQHVKRHLDSSGNDTVKPRTENLPSPEDIAAEYRRIRGRWEDEAACQELRRCVQGGEFSPVSRAVCLGIGTFDPPDGGWETKRRTFIQLIAFLVLVESLEAEQNSKIECFFQEPIFTSSDRAFIESLGHLVVGSPQGFEMIHDKTLLFGIHLYRPVYARALGSAPPAVFAGTDLDVWDWVTLGKDSEMASIKNANVIESKYAKRMFPQDSSTTAFSSTSLYWRRRDSEPAVEDQVNGHSKGSAAQADLDPNISGAEN